MTCVMYHFLNIYIYLFSKGWSQLVEGLLSTWPDPSSFYICATPGRTGDMSATPASLALELTHKLWNAEGGRAAVIQHTINAFQLQLNSSLLLLWVETPKNQWWPAMGKILFSRWFKKKIKLKICSPSFKVSKS